MNRTYKDPTLAMLNRAGVPPTRERYIEVAFLGEYNSDNLDPELEAELPVQFQRTTLLETPPASEKLQ
jgi:hypothetical protein